MRRERQLVLHIQCVALLHLPHSRFDEATSEVTAEKILQVGRMDAPVVSLAVFTAFSFAEALVQGKVVAHAISPSRGCRAKERVESLNTVVNVLQTQLSFVGAQDDSSNHLNVGNIWFENANAITGARSELACFAHWGILFVVAVG